jgi:valyl-tRNA synthetase
MPEEIKPQYNPAEAEGRVYALWEESGYFNPDNLPDAENREPYTIIMPPLNANAAPHAGHALGLTIQDILIRYLRMAGRKTLYLPGTDHAGFETQVVFEKKLEKEGRSRFQMTREEFYKECWDFVRENKKVTEAAIRRMGVSCDWSRNVFTLDPEIIDVVYATFKDMHEDGLIYRGRRICNWCPKHQTALSDLETKHEERHEPFFYFKYGPFIIGTSRPETKFGDKYVVTHPDDPRYAEYKHGDTLTVEWINGPIEATVLKDRAVDMNFGSGVMTITPAHDAVDFDIAERLELDMEQIIDMRGKLLPIAGEFAGTKILDARPKIVEKLAAKGLVDHIDETYKHNVQLCYKCGSLIEPQILLQWFVKMTEQFVDRRTGEKRPSLRDMAIAALDRAEVKIVTERFEKIFRHWMRELRDWPISRQIAWGIPIPVWYRGEEIEISAQKPPGEGWEKDPDTFDTWFSSGQWPYATMMANDAKHDTNDLRTFFPTQMMETGWDIIFFWVSRMIMFSYYKFNKPPFETVYLHGLVRAKDRQKMSKSKGNVADPLGIIDAYGTDALRFALIFSTAAGNDIPLSEDKIRGMKHFANKLWNIARFVLTNAEPLDRQPVEQVSPVSRLEPITDADKEIIAKLEVVKKEVTENLENFRLHEAAQAIYDFTWHDFADVYIEKSKEQLKDASLKLTTNDLLLGTLKAVLKLLHPFMPFITEEIYQKFYPEKVLMIEAW